MFRVYEARFADADLYEKPEGNAARISTPRTLALLPPAVRSAAEAARRAEAD